MSSMPVAMVVGSSLLGLTPAEILLLISKLIVGFSYLIEAAEKLLEAGRGLW